MITEGSGKLITESTEKKVSMGDIFTSPNGFELEAGNDGIGIVFLEIEEITNQGDLLMAKKVLGALDQEYCSPLPELTKITKGYGFIKYSSPNISIIELAKMSKVKPEDLLVAINSVQITGDAPIDEELHFHKSSIFAIIYSGAGVLMEPHGIRTTGKEGDAIIVPVGTRHYFEAKDGHMSYCGIEFGKDGTDYQKHLHASDKGDFKYH